MAAKRFLNNLFKPSHNKRENHDKENNDPLLGGNFRDENGQRRSILQRRVNFQQSGGRGTSGGGRRRSYATDLVEEDGASEVTLTATEVNRPRQNPPNPYSVVTEPKRNLGPRSCPGGAQFFDFDSLDSSSGTGGGHAILERSLEARSEFLPPHQHRRSSRRRMVGGGGTVIGGGQQEQHHHRTTQPALSEIGNGHNGRHHHWGAGREGGGGDESVGPSGAFGRYKNLPLADPYGGGQQLQARLREQQSELAELGGAYREERARRKALQRDLRREQQARERLTMETFRLQSIIGLLLRQQQNTNSAAGIELNTLIGAVGLCPPSHSAWTNTPSSSSAVPLPIGAGAPSWSATPNPPPPPSSHHFGLFPVVSHQNNFTGGPGECLAAPLLSSSSLLLSAHHHGRPASHQDEVKVFRTGQHNTDSFSGGSSRPTTGELAEMERDKTELISETSREQTNFSSPEIGRGRGNGANGSDGTLLLGCYSFSADDCQGLTAIGKPAHNLVDDPPLGVHQQPSRDDGYATSETNISASTQPNDDHREGEGGGGIAPQERGHFGGGGRKTQMAPLFGRRRSMSAETF